MIGRAAIGYPWILMKSNITENRRTFSKTNCYRQSRSCQKSLDLGRPWNEGERLGMWKRVLIIRIISKEFIL
jgi:hypothetical protein